MTVPAKMMFLQVGKRRYQVASFEQASLMFCAARDKANCGASKISAKNIVDEVGNPIAYVSYNGRVWDGAAKDWKPGAVPLYPLDGGYVQ